ncbi:HemK/PrmC family methyltransferase [Scrofimicrobium sp. R131]|uniref:peptide chain release factor N(5)-glutamine methyltransferase n=1 Tax=Scrofimicrobium appendicitidis TaxID=3079930 RepID=A0AAU7V8E9_9ACTO
MSSRPGPAPLTGLLRWGTNQLRRAGKPEQEARWLLEWALGVDTLLRAQPEVGARAAERYRSAIAQRRAGFPLQHITGTMQFRSLTLQAGPGVFAVRPETELLVEVADVHRGDLVVDLCAGSGAIGLAVAAEHSGVEVIGVELSPVAAAYARRNADQVSLAPGSSYRLVQGDATVALPELDGQVNLVLTNPPYVPGTPALTGEVLFDPEMALYGGGEDGLVLPRGIARRARRLLAPGGQLLMEHDERQGPSLCRIAEELGFTDPQTLPDLTGRPRFLSARVPA